MKNMEDIEVIERLIRKEEAYVALLVGGKMKEIRQAKKYALDALAESLGVSKALLQQWETGQAYISAPRLAMFCRVLNISMDNFDIAKL